jgi:hypothetical protein
MDKKIKIYNATLPEDAIGLYTVSLVENPAFETEWLAFSKDKEEIDFQRLMFSVMGDEMQRKVMVVICRADYPILRKKGNELIYVVFSKDVIKEMSQRFLANGFQNSVNIEHKENSFVDGVEMEQLFIKDINKGVDPQGFENIEDGSLFAVYKVNNDEVWEGIKSGVWKSVSLEGLFKMVEAEEEMEPKETDKETIETFEDMMEWLQKEMEKQN